MTGLMREMTGLEKLRELAEAIKQGEDRKAIAWVREHGGLESVKKLLDWVVGHCSTRQQLDFDFWLSGRVMHELGFEEDMADRDEVERRLLARLMPEGYEWPRWDDGAPVLLSEGQGKDVVHTVAFNFHTAVIDFKSPYVMVNPLLMETSATRYLDMGQSLKRPAPKVLDADGVEIRVGDTVCGTRDMEPMRVVDTDSRECGFKHIKCEKEGDGFWFYCPDELTHKLPVIAADGKPLREGEHVYHVETGAELVVKELPKPGEYQAVVVFATPASHLTSFDPDQLTHEQPDTWERIEEDKGLNPFDYCKKVGHKLWTFDNAEEFKASDLVRRAKKLAGVGE